MWMLRELGSMFLRRQDAKQVLVEERGNDEGVVLKSRILDDRVNPGLIREVGNIVLAAADRFNVWKGRPNEVPNAGFLRGADCCTALRYFIGAAFLPEIGDGENAVGSLECGFKRLWAVQISLHDFGTSFRQCSGFLPAGVPG
jgi:hypothetical protein